MKRSSFIKFMPIAMLAFAAISCSNEKDVFDPNAVGNQKKAEYAEAFTKQFGQINPQHNWGFTDQVQTTTKGTRSANTNANEWGGYVEVPAPLTQEQIDIVTNWFNNNVNPKGIAVNWSDFFVQQVSNSHSNMEYLTCGDNNEHINNFNNGNGQESNVWYGELNSADKNDKKYGKDKIMFMQNSSTSKFGYHNSIDNDNYYDYVIIPGDRIDKSLTGMYFVGFDYQANGQADNQKEARDNKYQDWIVRITPGIYKDAQRVIAEDLGNIGDFDFNDVVFDVKINYYENWKEGSYAVITLRAAGGTMPLTVGGKEVHEAFGVETDKMVNTGEGSVSCPVVVFRLPAECITSANANDIPVVVENNGKKITLVTNVGEAPAKICVPTTYKWTTERTNIKTAYKGFEDYVSNPEKKDWCENPEKGTTVE